MLAGNRGVQMKVALLGYSQSGRKTLFTLLTGRAIPPAYREGEVLEGIAPVYDPRVDVIARICKPEKIKYAENTIVLCPPVQAGAAAREWLEAARRCDLLCILVRGFTSAEVYHPAGSVDARRDHTNLEAELVLSDLDLVEKRLERMGKEKRAGLSPAQMLEEKVLHRCKEALENGRWLNALQLEPHELGAIKSLSFLTLLPVLWAYNVDEDSVAGAEPAGPGEFRVSCRIEQEIAAIEDPAERREYLKGMGLELSGLERMNRAAY